LKKGVAEIVFIYLEALEKCVVEVILIFLEPNKKRAAEIFIVELSVKKIIGVTGNAMLALPKLNA
jgi:multisubunit Na+/H+ antiporter MnhE subunit